MSTAVKWLENLNKEPLMQFAEKAGVQVNKSDNKKNIATAIYNQLVAQRSAFEKNPDPQFAGFYRRLESPPSSATSSRTPARKAPAVEVASPSSPALRSTRRQAPKREESSEGEASSESEASAAEGPEQTPKRVAGIELPPSPAVITEAIDRQSAALSKRVNDAWSASGVEKRSHALRAKLSSVKAIETIVVALEGFSILRELWPLQYITTLPAVESIHTPELAVKLPEFFTLFDGVFWAPFSLWLLTSIFLPLVVSYFFNLSLQHSGAAGSRRGGKASTSTFDPLAFNIAKALLAYLVYGKHFTFWDVYSKLSIEKIYASVPGQLNGLFTGAGVGLLGALYEAILTK